MAYTPSYGASGVIPWGSAAQPQRYDQTLASAAPGVAQSAAKIEAAGPRGFGDFIEPSLMKALDFQLNQGGMSKEAFAGARSDLGQALNQALSRQAGAGAARGAYNPGNVKRQSRPTIAMFGRSLADLYGKRAELRQQAMAEALRSGVSLAPIAADAARARQEGFGELLQASAIGSGPNYSFGTR